MLNYRSLGPGIVTLKCEPNFPFESATNYEGENWFIYLIPVGQDTSEVALVLGNEIKTGLEIRVLIPWSNIAKFVSTRSVKPISDNGECISTDEVSHG